jgi:hypothetical protein
MGFPSISTTRVAAAASLLALAAVTASDFFLTEFWNENTMATSVVADVLVLIVGVAVVNEFVAARARRQWSMVADYALVELGSSSRHVWIRLAEEVGIGSRQELTRDEMRQNIEDRDRLRGCTLSAVADPEGRERLHEVVAQLVSASRATLTNWAPLLVETPRATSLSRYIELQALLSRIDLVLWEDVTARRPSFVGSGEPEWLCERICSLILLSSQLEREFFDTAGMVDRGERIEARLPAAS